MQKKQKKILSLRILRRYLCTIESLQPNLLYRPSSLKEINDFFRFNIINQMTKETISIYRNYGSYFGSLDRKSLNASRKLLGNFKNMAIFSKKEGAAALIRSREVKSENIYDDWVPVSNIEKIDNGINSLYLQGVCPFRSYSNTRLQVNFIYEKYLKKSYVIKGMASHYALALVLNKIKKYRKIFKPLPLMEKKLISLSVNISLIRLSGTRSNYLSFSIEKSILTWLKLEFKRRYFCMENTEKTKLVNIGKVSFCFRPDRIDKLTDAKKIVIDYKHNKNKYIFRRDNIGVQLPVYCLLFNKNRVYDGICIGLVRDKTPEVKVITQEKKIKNTMSIFNWKSILFRWKDSLEKLSYEFCQGLVKKSTGQ